MAARSTQFTEDLRAVKLKVGLHEKKLQIISRV